MNYLESVHKCRNRHFLSFPPACGRQVKTGIQGFLWKQESTFLCIVPCFRRDKFGYPLPDQVEDKLRGYDEQTEFINRLYLEENGGERNLERHLEGDL